VWHLGHGLRGLTSGSDSALEQCAHFLGGGFDEDPSADVDVEDDGASCCWDSVGLSDIRIKSSKYMKSLEVQTCYGIHINVSPLLTLRKQIELASCFKAQNS